MQVLVFSDTHLTKKFEPKRYLFLKNLIQQADRVVINGDFWEASLISLKEFTASPWKKLFPLLKAKKAIYLYGNHDHQQLATNEIREFSLKQADHYQFKLGGRTYHIRHGDTLEEPHLFENSYWLRYLYETLKNIYLKIGIRLFGEKFMRQSKFFNNHIKNYYSEVRKQAILVTGHSHSQVNEPQNNYINTGFINFGIAQYLLIDEQGFHLYSRRY